ncbi:T9SS type A sorting domain-containing protein, partial [Flavobacterium sp.]|uniref:T9SS type A sorting domain-containing protein n=1 Tax=Flavobacterium sp. TaxID=239 RepID=UPI0037B9F0CD
ALPILTDIVACSCQVASGKVTIDSSNTMTLTNELIVAPTGTLTFNSSATDVSSNPISNSGSLVQINDTPLVANSGAIIYNRTVPAIHNTDYTYWSSPVSSETLATFSPYTPTDKFYSYNASGDFWAHELATNTMDQGTGYCVYGPQNANNSNFDASFSGVPNNGPVSITGLLPNTYETLLIGNPYPSAIDADLFITENLGIIDGGLYFWTHNTDPINGQYSYSDYATYNLTGGAGTKSTKGVATTSANNNTFFNANTPNGYIAAGQGFFVVSDSISVQKNIVFKNSMRVAGVLPGVNTNSQFFKTKGNTKGKSASSNSIEKDRVWLNLTNDQGVFKQTLVGYITGATNDYDTTYDADSYDSLDAADFYSVLQDSNLVIQGRALPFDANDTVPIGFRSSSDGSYTINIDQVDGLLANQDVFIEDKLTNTVTDLKSGDYKFSTVAGTFNDRFVLKYTNVSKTLSVVTDKVDGIMVFYSNNYNTLIIHNGVLDSTVNSVALYNMAGQNISNWDVKDSDQTNIQIPIKDISSGIYIVKVKTTTGESNKKIIVN